MDRSQNDIVYYCLAMDSGMDDKMPVSLSKIVWIIPGVFVRLQMFML